MRHDAHTDWRAMARAAGFAIPEQELEQIADVLEPLVLACRDSFDEELALVEPVGTFCPDES